MTVAAGVVGGGDCTVVVVAMTVLAAYNFEGVYFSMAAIRGSRLMLDVGGGSIGR